MDNCHQNELETARSSFGQGGASMAIYLKNIWVG